MNIITVLCNIHYIIYRRKGWQAWSSSKNRHPNSITTIANPIIETTFILLLVNDSQHSAITFKSTFSTLYHILILLY